MWTAIASVVLRTALPVGAPAQGDPPLRVETVDGAGRGVASVRVRLIANSGGHEPRSLVTDRHGRGELAGVPYGLWHAVARSDHTAPVHKVFDFTRKSKARLRIVVRRIAPFPKAAKWILEGKVRADAVLEPSGLQNAVDLTLPNVLVFVDKLEHKWAFPSRTMPPPRIVLDAERDFPSVSCTSPGSRVLLRNAGAAKRTLWIELAGDAIQRLQLEPSDSFHALDAFRRDLAKPIWQLIRVRDAAKKTLGVVHFLPHPIFAVTDDDGRFRLPQLPDGGYELVAFHERLGVTRAVARIRAGHPSPMTISFPVPTKLKRK